MPTTIPFPPPPDAPAIEAARGVLLKRISELKKPLRRMRARPGENPEHVHKLRVATRRLGAALRIFEPVLDTKQRKDLARAARRLRRAAGNARDLDVLESMILARLKSDARPPGDALAVRRRIQTQRKRAYRKMVKALPGAQDDLVKAARAVQRSWKRSTVRSLPHRDATDQRCADLAHEVMFVTIAAFGAAAAADLKDFEALHECRIATKRLRYSMEVFANCFPSSFSEELYSQVEELQGVLGEINDLRNLHGYLVEVDEPAARRDHESEANESQTAGTFADLIERELGLRTAGFLQAWPSRIAALRRGLTAAIEPPPVAARASRHSPVHRLEMPPSNGTKKSIDGWSSR